MNQGARSTTHNASKVRCWEPAYTDTILAALFENGNTQISWHVRRSGCYRSWTALMQRTSDNACERMRKKYFNKGITVCERWKESFWNFYADMGGRPLGSHLDRIDDSEGFYKENCWWTKPLGARTDKNKERYMIAGSVHTAEFIAKHLAVDVHHVRLMRSKSKTPDLFELTTDAITCLHALQTNRMQHRGKTKTINQWADDLCVHPTVLKSALYSCTTPAVILSERTVNA